MQCAVIEEVAAGRSVHEAAGALGRGEETVRTHLKAAYARLGVSSRAELVSLLARTASLSNSPRSACWPARFAKPHRAAK
jgi:DNA-binding NarL/FixJ family response regulator